MKVSSPVSEEAKIKAQKEQPIAVLQLVAALTVEGTKTFQKHILSGTKKRSKEKPKIKDPVMKFRVHFFFFFFDFRQILL